MAIKLGLRSRLRLNGVHPDLVRVIKRAADISDIDFTVLEGLRTRERQRQLVAAGASRTMNSRHITGHAVDLGVLVGGQVRWDWPLYSKLSAVVKRAAELEKVPIDWGGDWPKFRDGPHYQLSKTKYP